MAEILTRDELVRRTQQDRAEGKTVALAGGAFDLLHTGHIRYLESAAREADVLVVAVADDASVCGRGDEGRPIMPEEDRAELVAALRCVDYVVIVPEPGVGPLLEVLHPHVHCRGFDDTAGSKATSGLLARIARD